MQLPRRFHARCFDPTRRWSGRLRAALDSSLWCVMDVDSCDQFGAEDSSPALLLCVLDDVTSVDAARWWSIHRARVNPRSPLVIVQPTADAGVISYWQELGATAVLTTTLELPLVLRLAEHFAANPAHLAPDQADPLTPFWQALPWADALPKAGRPG